MHDGVLTVLGFVSGASALLPDPRTVLFTGIAGMFAEGLSMGVGEYQSTCAENEVLLQNIAEEKEEIKRYPKEERKALAQYFSRRGVRHWEAKRLAKELSRHQERFLEVVLKTERGLAPQSFETPLRNSWYMGIASFIGGLFPILPYAFLDKGSALAGSILLSGLTVFLLGVLKCRFTKQDPWRTGGKMMILAMGTALIAYVIGEALSRLY